MLTVVSSTCSNNKLYLQTLKYYAHVNAHLHEHNLKLNISSAKGYINQFSNQEINIDRVEELFVSV